MSGGSVLLGSITGLTYAILSVGLILIYRANRFINFAHGSLGALAAVVFLKLVVDFDVPYFLALAAVVVFAGALGALVEVTVIRRLSNSPPLVLVVATIALSQLFFFFSLLEQVKPDPTALVQEGFPLPFQSSVEVAGVILTGAHLSVLFFVPLLALGLAVFLRYSPYGQAIRAAADNPDAARLAGISVRRMSTLVWVLAGVLACLTAMMLVPLRGSVSIGTMGPSILVRALGAGLVARMLSLPIAFAASIAIGIFEAVVFAEANLDSGPAEVAVFLVVLLALAVRGQQLSRSIRDRRADAVGFGSEPTPLADRLAAVPAYQRLRTWTFVAITVAAVGLPFVPLLNLNSSRTLFLLSITCAYAIVGVSLTVLTGWAGQVSLGQFALVGVGAVVVARFDLPVPVAVLAAGATAAAVSILVGLPAVRIQGLFLAVATLAFGVLATQWIFQEEFFVETASGLYPERPDLLRTERAIYFFALALLLGGLWLARNLRRSGPGRLLVAVRDNDAAAKSAGISPMWSRLLGFGLAGFLAGSAGTVFTYARQAFVAPDYPPQVSLQVLLMVAVGGLGSLSGAVLGAVFMFGLPALFGSSDLLTLLTSSVGVLIVLLYLPGGLWSVVESVREAVAVRLHRRDAGLPAPPRTRPTFAELWRTLLDRPVQPDALAPAGER